MLEGLFNNLNIQEFWGSLMLQLKSIFDPENFQFLAFLHPFWDKISDNPLASIITLLFLVGLPYTLIKAKQSSTEANDRLDRLMEEMKDFEFEKPLIDLKENFKDIQYKNSRIIDYDLNQDVLEFNLENDVPDLSLQNDDSLEDLEPASFSKQISLDQDATDEFLARDPLDSQPEDENRDLSPMADNDWAETKTDQDADPADMEDEFAKYFFDDLQVKDQESESASGAEEIFNETEMSAPETGVEEEEHANYELDDLQSRMKLAIKNLREKYSPPEETTEIAATENEDTKENEGGPSPSSEKPEEENGAQPSPESVSPDLTIDGQEDSPRKSPLITHLKSFQKNLENRFESNEGESKISLNDSPPELTFPTSDNSTDKEYQEALESFLFLKNQKKPE